MPRDLGLSARTSGGALFGAKRLVATAAGSASRASGRGGGTTLPGRLLLRLAPDAIARLGARLDGDVTLISATNGKTTTAGMLAAVLAADGRRPVHNRAGSNMTWGIATALLEQQGGEGLFEVDEAWLPEVAGTARPVADRARQSLPRPARPLRRDRGPGRRLGADGGRARWAQPASPSTPTTPWSPTSVATRTVGAATASSTSGSTTLARRCPSCSTPSTPSTAGAVAIPTPTSGPSSATSATTPARIAARAARARRRRDADRAARHARLAGHRPDPTGRSCASSCPCPASTTSTTPWRLSPPACRWGSSRRGSRPR